MRWLLIAVFACGGAGKPAQPAGGGDGDGAGSAHGATTSARCTALRSKVEQLYRAEAQHREPNRVDEAVADDTAMAMTDCARAPAEIAACIAAVGTAAELDARCLLPIDDEGTEGDKLAR
jgi:hypothetical protein